MTTHIYTNALLNETSPYLLMHAHNPVKWYPWGREALKLAKESNKLMVISIGYAACHWCHVMEKESFSDNFAAGIMNEHFVSIKIDREERPDLDQLFMDVAHLTTGKGGWPLNIIALPDGRPVFAGTYFQKRQWLNLLNEIQQLFIQSPEKLNDLADQIKQGIERMDFVGLVKDSALFTAKRMDNIVDSWKQNLDFDWGGNKGAPKFPMPVEFKFLLTYLSKKSNADIEQYVNLSLSRIAWGGIYDHVGGGFSRYSVDEYWKVPHFEKMLYDQGQLLEVYANAFQLTQNPLFKKVIEETIEFANRELKSPEGGYYASIDADSEGEEGRFYVWNKNEVEELLGDEAELFCAFYNITEKGNWESGKNVLFQTVSLEQFVFDHGLILEDLSELLQKGKEILFAARNKRVRPGLDDKILTAWNAIMIKGLVHAYRATGNPEYLNNAIETSKFIQGKAIQEDGGLWRSLKAEKATINAFLDDYALLIDAWIDLYQVTFDEQWLVGAHELCEYASCHFFNDDNQLYYYTSILDDPLMIRKSELSDNVIPASNSVMAMNLFRLSKYFLNKEGYHTSLQMLKNLSGRIDDHGKYYANWQRLKLFFIHENYELVIAGEGKEQARDEFLMDFNPFVFVAGESEQVPIAQGKTSKQLAFYLCKNNTCKLPIRSILGLKRMMVN
ncbi:thioredoxin domain-containing protein [Labilibacter marinus]|uniref:thioredoxin domain-containing protein n=1 Tax=Labilibacter marinus TaxID=1477105 RepID=UPI00094FB540|nr:thioredoxin domain-containing protein [Labilibacter marinus]